MEENFAFIGIVATAIVIGGMLLNSFKAFKERQERKNKEEQEAEDTGPEVVPHDLEKLRARLRGLAADDPLWPLLLAALAAEKDAAAEQCALGEYTGDEAHRLRGRLAMVLDLQESFARWWRETHPPRKTESRGENAENQNTATPEMRMN